MSNQIILAIPSKGRLEEQAARLFADSGMELTRIERGYEGEIKNMGAVRVVYLPADEIAARLVAGEVDLGITGEDLLREEVAQLESRVALLGALGFGGADVVLAVPDGWADVLFMADLEEVAFEFRAREGRPLRVATKYMRLAADFLAKHNVYDAVVVESQGATEGAPARGAAEAIVDITSTGDTLRANGLRVLEDGVILKSQATLAAALHDRWLRAQLKLAEKICERLDARLTALRTRQIQVSDGRIGDDLANELEKKYDVRGIKQDSLLVAKDKAQEVCELLVKRKIGRASVSEITPELIYGEESALYARLAERLG